MTLYLAIVMFLTPQIDDSQEAEHPGFYSDSEILREYIEEALARSPSIYRAKASYRSAREKVARVSGFPDPVVSFSRAIRSIETRVGPQRNSLQVIQKLPWFGKRDLAGKGAIQEGG